jgi:sugar (pentulose or hexulose) kinase|tara:strand:- start:26179 stop:27726 length:1548 start_codon:yes stop_codon:yes gene_type:complete
VKDKILAIDNGSQSIRALLFDLDGNLLFKSKIEIEAYFSEQPGWAEQHPEYYWDNVGVACRNLWDQGADPQSVAGLSVTTQRGTMVFLDDKGESLRPASTWMDQRQLQTLQPMSSVWELLIKVSGKASVLDYVRKQAPSNWVAHHQPEIWAKTAKYLQLSGYLNYKLTGEYKDSVGSQVGYIPFEYKIRDWAPSYSWHWQAYSIQRDQLPELVQPGERLGLLQGQAAAHIGLPEGVPIIASGADKACEMMGSGLIADDVACLSYGTRATINTHTKKYFEPVRMMPAYPAAMPDMFMTEAAVPRGFWMVSWFKKEFGQHEQVLAAQQGIAPETLFDDLVNQVPPGSMGLMLQPYWGRDIAPGPEAKGAIIGFGEVHTRAHMYRSILEGLAFALREGREAIEKRGKKKITRLRVSGGGSQSRAAMQITADVFGLPAERPHTFETSGLGAAIVAAVGLGFHRDFETAMAKMTREGDVFYPNPDSKKIYDALYSEVYQGMYKRLEPMYKSIRKITGYPQ